MAKTIAIKVRILILKFSKYIKNNTPINETGIVINGIIEARAERKARQEALMSEHDAAADAQHQEA